jgi:hypothetical protein
MAVSYAPRVSETVTVTGTGTVTLSGTPSTGYQTWFSGFGAAGSATVGYCIVDNTTGAWETGIAAFNGGNPGTLTRGFLFSSTGSTISFAGNPCTVSCDFVPNANGQLDISAMPFGAGALTLAPLGTNVSVLGYLNNIGTGNITTTANRQSFVPFVVSKPTVINNLGCIVNTASAGTTFSVGIYADNGNSGGTGNIPSGSPLVSVSGLSSATAGSVLGSVGTPYALQPNTVYWRSSIHSAAVSMKVITLGGEAGALGIGPAGSLVTGYYVAGSGTILVSPFSGTPGAGVTTAWPLTIYS